MKRFQEAIAKKQFLTTCELGPPKGTSITSIIDIAQSLKDHVHAINITDGQGGNMRMSPVIASYLIQTQAGVETICQLVCRDRNSIALQSDILGALSLGIDNYLALTGDKAGDGDNPQAQEVFELNTNSLLKVFNQFSAGTDLAGNRLDNVITRPCLGSAAHPGMPDLSSQADKMKRRIAQQGVSFFQTQIVYDHDQLSRFLESLDKAQINVPVLIGVTPLKSLRMAQFMNEKLYGVEVPEQLIRRLESSENQSLEGIKIAAELIAQIKKLGGTGIHLMAVGQEKQLPEIIRQII